jgi:hypothetical protein
MKRNAIAVAQNPSVQNNKKVVKAVIAETIHVTSKEKNVDTNKLSAEDMSIIQTIDARLQDLYYLTDEEDIIGFC